MHVGPCGGRDVGIRACGSQPEQATTSPDAPERRRLLLHYNMSSSRYTGIQLCGLGMTGNSAESQNEHHDASLFTCAYLARPSTWRRRSLKSILRQTRTLAGSATYLSLIHISEPTRPY